MSASPFETPDFRWTDSLSVGIRKIDIQHRILIRLLNHLSMAVSQQRFKSVPDLLLAFDDYARVHFAVEEGLLDKHGYPESAAHKKEHEIFKTKIDELKSADVNHLGQAAYDLLCFLAEWLLHHIADTDKKYSSFLVSKGVS